MKTNVSIELTDAQRNAVANRIDQKVSKRMVTRAEVNALCQGAIDSLLVEDCEAVNDPRPASHEPRWADHPRLKQFEQLIDKQIAERGYTPEQAKSYRRGWVNKPFKA